MKFFFDVKFIFVNLIFKNENKIFEKFKKKINEIIKPKKINVTVGLFGMDKVGKFTFMYKSLFDENIQEFATTYRIIK
jgi:hypothetical protein